jgi:hypothetical protein
VEKTNSRKVVSLAKSVTQSDAAPTILSAIGFTIPALILVATKNLVSFSDKILQRMVGKFFTGIFSEELSDSEKRNVAQQMAEMYKTDDDRQEFNDCLLEYLNSLNNEYKAMLAGKIFRYFLIGDTEKDKLFLEITKDDFWHTAEMMQNMPVDILKAIEKKYDFSIENMKNYSKVNNKYMLAQYGMYELKVDTETIIKKNKSDARRSMNGETKGSSDDLIAKTFYGEVLENAIADRSFLK